MTSENVNSLFFTCSLIEYIGRVQTLRRAEVVSALGKDTVLRILRYADTFHCEPIAKVADDFIRLCHVPRGDFDNVSACRYVVPSYWDIGAVHARLIEDVANGRPAADVLVEVYSSWMEDALSRFNSDLFYQSRGYLAACYRASSVLAA